MMKFLNQVAFEKHLFSLRSTETLFLVLAAEERELKDLSFKVKESLVTKGQAFDVQVFTCGKDSIASILEAYNSMSLFSKNKVIELCDVHVLNANEWKIVKEKFTTHQEGVFTILLAKKRVKLPDEAQKRAVELDLLSEKPWDHKKRLMGLLFEYVKKANKTITYEAIEQLVELVGVDYGKLLQQLESLICFTGARTSIDIKDLSYLNIARKKQKTWQLAEYLTWGEGGMGAVSDMNDSDFYSLLSQVRFRLNVGVKIKEGIHPDEIAPSLLQKYLRYSERLSKDYFLKAFLEVYDIERLSRRGQFSTSLLFDMLFVKLSDLRKDIPCMATSPA
ncbi:MAG: hypothetical protein P0S95_01150 [Rhabdochlamydiaceae bacterium]|nr:hypothetical protein [Candidatus Amphrikana amoebophyrae]